MILAIPQAVIHHRALCAFSESLRQEFQSHLSMWERDVLLWERDKSQPCPYDVPEPRTSFVGSEVLWIPSLMTFTRNQFQPIEAIAG